MQQVGQEEAEDFVERVDEVTRLIEGLKDGSLPPEYIDKRESEIVEREQKKEESRRKEEQELEENRFDKLPKERQQELLKKVEDLQRNKERKDKLRAAFEAHVEDRKRTGGKVSGTDYHAWDLWTPSDEEDEIYNNLTPNSAEFKALEKDIDERHAKLLKSRQYAERQRELGNKMFKAKQYAKALQIYEEGIASEKSNMALNANAAAAALKLGCNIQAIEHCDKVFSIADFCFENKPSTEAMRLKAYQRRAAARLALKHFHEAIADLKDAKKLAGKEDKEINQQLQKAEKMYQEHKIGKKLKKVIDNEDVDNEEANQLRSISELSKGLHLGSGKEEEACEKIADLVKNYENGRIFARECGVLNKAMLLYIELSKDSASSSTPAVKADCTLKVLNCACFNDQNAEYVCNYPSFLKTCVSALSANATHEENFGILQLLHTCSIESEPRKTIASEIKKSSNCLNKLCSFVGPGSKQNLLFVSLQLLGNMCLQATFRKNLTDSVDLWQMIEGALDVLAIKELVMVHEAVGSLLGNLCNEGKVRAMFAKNERSIKRLLDFMRMKKLNLASEERFPKLLTIVTNLSVEEGIQEPLCKCGGVLRMLDLLEEHPSHSKQIANCIARLSRIPSGARTLISSGNLSKLFARIAASFSSKKEALDGIPEDAQDSLVRVAANVIMKSGQQLESISDALLPLGLYSLVRKAIMEPSFGDLLVGNAALCVSELARSEAVMERLDHQGAIELIEPLTKIAHKRTGSAQRNAAIALARMAKTPQYIDKLREHHAFEIIAKYVKI